MPRQPFFQTGRILSINLRRDWLKLLIWLIALSGLFASIAAKFNNLYGSKTAIEKITATLNTPAMISLFGRLPHGPYSSADAFAGEMTVFMAIFGVIMNFSLAISLTRGDEDSGVTELVSARYVGPYATMMAAINELMIANGLLALLYAGGLQVAGLNGTNTGGNLVLGISLGLNGLMFGLLAVVCAQLAASSRAATSLAYLLFGVIYLARMLTDVSYPRYTWLSPLGWVEKLQTYRSNNWLPAMLMLITIVVLMVLTIMLRARRDLNAGILATRPGRRHASLFLRGPVSLVGRLERNTILAWIIGLFIFGAMYGSVFNTVADILKSNPITLKLLADPHTAALATTQVLKSFIALLMIIFAVCAIIPGLQIIFRLATDEQRGMLEMLHARPVSRFRLNVVLSIWGIVTSVLALTAAVGGLAVAANMVLDHPLANKLFIHGLLANISPLLIFLGAGALLVGWLPKLRSLVWLYLGATFVMNYFGRLFDLPEWATKLSPFGFIGHVPASSLNWSVFWWQTGIAAALFVVGLIGYQLRDLNSAN